MSILRSYLIALFVCLPALSFAELPSDADRGVDVELAGLLYSQGIYRNRSGSFVLLSQDVERGAVVITSDSVRFPESSSNNERIDDWIRSTGTKVSFKELLAQ